MRAALGAVLFLLPLPFGAVEEGAVFAFEAATLALFALHLVFGSRRARIDDPGERAPLPSAAKILAAFFIGFGILQLLPLPNILLQVLSPQAFRLRTAAATVVSGGSPASGWGTFSLAPSLSGERLLLIICCFLFGYLVWAAIRTKKDLTFFAGVLIAGGVFQSFFGLAGFFSGSGKIWGFTKVTFLDSATGSYINRNHFSGYLEMIFPISLGFFLAKADFFSMKTGVRLKEKLLWFGQERLQKAFLLALLSILIGLGIFYSRSRTGIFVFFATFILLLLVLSVFGRKEGRSIKAARTILLSVLAGAILIGIGPVITRFAESHLAKEARAAYFSGSLELMGRFPVTGVGLGVFVQAYPMVRARADPRLVDHAHNDYLEFAVEAGWLATAALLAAALLALVWAVRQWRKRRDPLIRGVTLGALLGVAALFIHSLTDFNLQIPANAATFAAVFAMALAGPHCGKNGGPDRA